MSIKVLDKILDDDVELIGLTRKGISYKLFNSIQSKSPFTIKEWSFFLHLTERTLQRYKKENKSFEPLQSERILEIAQLQKRGIEIFGGSDNFYVWMNAKIIALGGIPPKELLDNSFGISILNAELTRIEYGVLA